MEQYPLPTLEEKKFSKLDLSHAYQQLELDDESSKYFAINTYTGLFTYSRLPFGVSYDIILSGATDVEHLGTLDLVLSRLEQSGVRLKEAKCTFLAEEVVLLGHCFEAQGIHLVKDKVQALLETRAPQNVT